jgi:hypothetical protein
MRPYSKTKSYLRLLAGLALLAALAQPVAARDAAFMDPSGSGNSDDAVRVDPKGDIDTGETTLGVAKRITLFFVNQTGLPIQVEKLAVNSDGNVAAEASNDDCSKQATIAAQSRCSVEISVTPTSPGAWSVDVLMTHNGAGRIARAKLSGKTGGEATEEKKENGLSLIGRESAPINFGEVSADGGKAVRSALMVNDSTDKITIYSIDVVEADNGHKRLDQGCAVDMELKPGESCPVTLLWAPVESGQVSTDLIIRHSGRLGFSVIPIRGTTKGGTFRSDRVSQISSSDIAPTKISSTADVVPPPPVPSDIGKGVEKVTSSALAAPAGEGLRLIGTVGSRGIFLVPDGSTSIAGAGDVIDVGNGRGVTVTAVTAKSADILAGDKKKTLRLEPSPELIAKAAAARAKDTPPPAPSMASMDLMKSGASSGGTGATAPTNSGGITGTAGTGGTGGMGGYK